MGKVAIAGPGRSGTSFLVAVLSACGIKTRCPAVADPGLSERAPHLRASREEIAAAPDILKNPRLTAWIPVWLREEKIDLDHVLICLRPISQVIASRQFQGWELDDEVVPDLGEWTDHARLGYLLDALTEYGIPFTFLRHPRVCLDAEYVYASIRHVFPGLDEGLFGQQFMRLSEVRRVRSYGEGASRPPI